MASGVTPDQIFTDQGLTGTKKRGQGSVRRWLLAAQGDTFVMTKLNLLE